MPDNKFAKNRIWMIILILIISSISAGLLTVINICTKPMIALNEEIKLKKSVLNVFSIPYKKKEIITVFDNKIETNEIEGKTVFEYYDRGKMVGIAFEMKGPGFWGPISSLVALEPDLNTIYGIEILHQEETPGLGGRIAEDEFKDQFRGKAVEPEVSIDAITGATMTSKAFKKIINENIKSFKEKWQKRARKKRR